MTSPKTTYNLALFSLTFPLVILIGICIALSQLVSLQSNTELSDYPTQAGQQQAAQNPTRTPAATIPPYTPLASLTPSQTLKPPPSLEPATQTPQPSMTPSTTPTATIDSSINLPGLHGAATDVPSVESSDSGDSTIATTGTGGGGASVEVDADCTVREDWGGVYEVQPNDALATIAQRYGTTMFDLAKGNCLADMNLISVGQQLRVPGTGNTNNTSNSSNGVVLASDSNTTSNWSGSCDPWEVVIPVNNTININSEGTITFQWRGPQAFRYLLRVISPSGKVFESIFDLRQNETINASDIQEAGQYSWYVFPLDENFQQIPCKEGGPWVFTKGASPTVTPTMTPQPPQPNFMTDKQGGTAPVTIQFVDQSQGTITEMLWSFGDGSNQVGVPGSLTPVKHTYATPGSYLVTLWVKGPNGEATTSKFITVN